MTQSRFYIPSLDGIRTVAFIIVFLSHTGLDRVFPGGFGVTIFFFLSGYLITTLLRREYERHQAINLKGFYLRRILRIFPPFYLVLFLGAGLTILGVIPSDIRLPGFGSQFFHYFNYYLINEGIEGGITPGSVIYWSLAVEEHFYLIFPFLYILLLKMRLSHKKQMLVFFGLCLLVLIWRCILVFGTGAGHGRIFYGSDTRIDSILFGSALAVYANPMLDPHYGSERLWKYLLVPAGIALIVFSLIYRSEGFRETFRYTIQGIGLYPLFVASIRFPNWGFFQVLNWSWMRFIGLLSYSLYLVHFTVIKIVTLYLPSLPIYLNGAIALILSFVLAYLIYKFVEVPCAKLRKKI